MDENKISQKLNEVNEPIINYGVTQKSRLTIFKSFEEAAEADYEFYRNLSPEERLSLHYQLSIKVFGESHINTSRRFSF
jgi:hypothetical protein